MDTSQSGQEWLARYADNFKVVTASLQLIWDDLNVSAVSQQGRLDRVHAQALACWPNALREAEQEREDVRDQVVVAREEIKRLGREIGSSPDEDVDRELSGASDETLVNQLNRVNKVLGAWRERRHERLEQHAALQGVCNALRKQLGRPQTPDKSKPDLTETGLQAMEVAGDRLRTEVKKQMRVLDDVLLTLSQVCLSLGEDEAVAAGEVHPSLRHYKPLSLQQGTSVRASQAHTEPDLSPETFDGLQRKIAAMARAKEAKEAEAEGLYAVLIGLWELLEIGEDDINRQLVTFAMKGPARLQPAMLDQVKNAIVGLEGKKAALMRSVAVSNRAEVERICEGSRMQPPPPPLGFHDETPDSGQVAALLHSCVEQVKAMQTLAALREPVLQQVDEIDAALAEVEWMRNWKQEKNRFSGRHVGQSISRSTKAEELERQLPATMAGLRSILQQWAVEHNSPFRINGTNYLAEVLTQQEQDLQEALAAAKAAQSRARQGSASAAKSRTAAVKEEASRARPKTPGRIGAIHAQEPKTPSRAAAAARGSTLAAKSAKAGALTGTKTGGGIAAIRTKSPAGNALASPVSMNLGEKLLLSSAMSPPPASNAGTHSHRTSPDQEPTTLTFNSAAQATKPTVIIPGSLMCSPSEVEE
ncbi:hypothetical protein WJX73_008671 [Symbiochloris irregularis]|uniref:Uncharacterized protein n=1 Tax=Symbiochloris irregularis TaxID=706552 RepID=A0AAW1PNU5_9CHLO